MFTRKLATDVSYLACARRLLAGARGLLPAVRDPQRADARQHRRARRRAPRLRVPAPARHGRGALRGPAQRRRARHPLPRLRPGRQPSGSACPIWCAGCSRTAPTPPSSTASWTLRSRSRAWSATRRSSSRGPSPRPTRRSRCRRRSTARAAGTRAASTSPIRTELARLADRIAADFAPGFVARPGVAAGSGGPTAVLRSGRPVARDRQRRSRPIRPRSSARSRVAGRGFRAWDRTPLEERAACLERAADLYEANAPELLAWCVREAGKTVVDARGRGARGGRLPALLRGRGAGPGAAARRCRARPARAIASACTGAACSSRSAPGTSRSRSSPARSPRRSWSATRCSPSPRPQTPLIAARAVALLHEAGVPEDALILLPGRAGGRRPPGREPGHRRRRVHRLDRGPPGRSTARSPPRTGRSRR